MSEYDDLFRREYGQRRPSPRDALITTLIGIWQRTHPEATAEESAARSREYLTHLNPTYVEALERQAVQP